MLALINLVHLDLVGGTTEKNDTMVDKEYLQNCRMLTMIECMDNDVQRAFQSDIEKRAIRNWSSYYDVYTIGGYNLSYNDEAYDAVNQIMTNINVFSEFSLGNAVDVTEWIARCKNGEVNIKQWGEQMKKSAIQYVYLYYGDAEVLDEVTALINSSGHVSVRNINNPEDGCAIIQLEGSNSLAYDNGGNELAVEHIPNGIKITETVDGENVYLSFLYHEKYVAYTMEGNYRKYLEVCKNKDGYMVINNACGNQVYVEYRDTWGCITIFFAIISTILLFVGVAVQQVVYRKVVKINML